MVWSAENDEQVRGTKLAARGGPLFSHACLRCTKAVRKEGLAEEKPGHVDD